MDDSPQIVAPASVVTDTNRKWATIAHLAVIAAALVPPLGGPVGPLLVKLAKGKNSPEVNREATEALNFGLTIAIAQIGAGLIAAGGLMSDVFQLHSLLRMLPTLVGLAAFGLAVYAGIAVNHGKSFRYPLTLRLFD